jgi:hypothetical protein
VNAATPPRGGAAGRRRRERAALAAALIERAGPIAAELDWQALDDAPAWLAAEEARTQKLQAQVGALLCAPSIRLWIDSARLAAATQAVGAPYLRALYTLPDGQVLPRDVAGATRMDCAVQVAPSLRSAGAGVMLAALPAGALRRVAAALWRAQASAMAGVLAQALVSRALTLAAQADKEPS